MYILNDFLFLLINYINDYPSLLNINNYMKITFTYFYKIKLKLIKFYQILS